MQAQTSCHVQQIERQLVQFTECVAKDANYKARARVPAAVDASQLDRFLSSPFVMSKARDTARALNTLFREGHDLFGSCDGPALSDFVQEFFCGDDPIDSDGK